MATRWREIGDTDAVSTGGGPIPDGSLPGLRVAVVAVSYNTLELTAFLLWSLHRVLDGPTSGIVIVDNGSDDGSRELLADADDAGLCVLLANDRNVGHGPALNQAMSFLSSRTPVDRVWILDSDCVVARHSVLAEISASPEVSAAAIVGEPHWDPWHGQECFGLYSLLIDPTKVLRPDVEVFEDGGDPAFALLTSAEQAGLQLAAFSFAADGYVIHLGRGSLAAVATRDDRDHPLHAWAIDHHEPHFGGIPGASERHASLLSQFRAEVGTPLGEHFVSALAERL
jgi:Glycosyl transferase family 2